MLKEYENFTTLTIPKGTVLFRGLHIEETDNYRKMFSDLLGYYTEGVFKTPPTQNVFFYPAPYVSQCVDNFNIHCMYVTNYDLELFLMIRPSDIHRGDRYNETNRYFQTCESISNKDKCGFEMKGSDACFTQEFLEKYPHINGYISIANTDAGKFLIQTRKMLQNKRANSLIQMLPCISQNSREAIGIPEIVLYPFHFRHNDCHIIRDNLYNKTKIIEYCIKNRAMFSYFPLFYITSYGVYSFHRLEHNIDIDYDINSAYINRKLFRVMKGLMRKLLGNTGYRSIQFSVDSRSGFYVMKFSDDLDEYTKGKLHVQDFTNDIKTIIPFEYPKSKKMELMTSIGLGNFWEELDTLEKGINKEGMSFKREYILEKGNKFRERFKVDKMIDRLDLGKKNFTRKNKRSL